VKKTLGLIFCFLSAIVHADWRLVHTDPSNSQFFIDPSNVRLMDGYKRAWILHNLPQANSEGTRSFRSVEEFDCVEKAGRVMQISAFDGEMAGGNLLARRHGNGQWVKNQSGSVDHMLLEAACLDQP
jgi:hypothetical protein